MKNETHDYNCFFCDNISIALVYSRGIDILDKLMRTKYSRMLCSNHIERITEEGLNEQILWIRFSNAFERSKTNV